MSYLESIVYRGRKSAGRLARGTRRLGTPGGRRKAAWAALHLVAHVLNPKLVYRIAGSLPFKPAPDSALAILSYEPAVTPRHVKHREAASVHGSPTWNIFPVRVDDTSELVSIDGGIANSGGHVFDRHGRLVRRACHKRRYEIEPGWMPTPWRPIRSIRRHEGILACLTASTHWNYYHWLFDVLPRLAILTQLEVGFDRIYLQRSTAFQRETLGLIGVDPECLLNCDDLPIIQADRLVVPCHQSTGRKEYPIWVSEQLRGWFLPSAGRPGSSRRIYVSRPVDRGRKIENEEEIVGLLESFGFELVMPERLSFLDQVRAFRDAEVVVAAHGAGLANIVFCRPGAKIIELFPPDMKYTYYKISRTVDLYYYFIKAPGEQNPVMLRRDYRIPLESLRQTLKLADIAPPVRARVGTGKGPTCL